MSITEDKNISTETYPYIFPDVDMKIQSVFRRRNKTVIPPNVAMLTKYKREGTEYPLPATKISSAPNPSNQDTKDFVDACKVYCGDDFSKPIDTKPNTSSVFTMNASENQLFRLQDAEINMIAQYGYYDEIPDLGDDKATTLPICKPMFGNQCLLSLFQMIELRIDGIPIERNAYPGFSSNMDYALRYPHCKTLEKDYEIHGFVSTDPKKYILPEAEISDVYETTRTAFDTFKQQGITCQVISQPKATEKGGAYDAVDNKWTKSQVNFYTGFINQRYKLSDIFTCVKDMPTIFNHKVEVVLQRASHNDIICNTFTANGTKCKFLGFWAYQLFQYVSETTNELSDYAKAYYSRPIETVITVKKDVQTPFIQKPTGSGNIMFNLGVDPSFKNCLLTLCIPRSAEMNGQYNSNKHFFTIDADGIYTSTETVDNSVKDRHYDTFYAPCNSYTTGGLKFLTVSNNGTILYTFTMEDDGTMKGPKENFRLYKPNTQMNYTNGNDINCPNYQDVYVQYLRAREHFEQPECEALDFNTFIKEYCFFCIDLSCFEINANQQLTVTMGFSTWGGDYQPYSDMNDKSLNYRATQIISNIYCMKILRLNPGRTVGVFDAATTTTAEVEAKVSI